jgi:hypothetical protein
MPVRLPDAEGRLRAAAAVVVALAALGLVAVASRSGRTETLTPITARSGAATPAVDRTLTPRASPPPSPPAESGRGWTPPGILYVLIVLALAGLVGYLGWRAYRSRGRPRWWSGRARAAEPRPDPRSDPGPDRVVAGALTDAVDAGLRQLDEGAARDAVIACWVLLERTAAEAGSARRPAETAAELTARVLRQHQVSADALSRLADLYREARYSAHPLGEAARDQARTALAQVRRELAGTEVAG